MILLKINWREYNPVCIPYTHACECTNLKQNLNKQCVNHGKKLDFLSSELLFMFK